MKKIFVKPQVSTQSLNAESMLMASGDPTVHTNESATQGGTALSKTSGRLGRISTWTMGLLDF